MKIMDPELAPDVSIWCERINPKEFEDGGCTSVVVGLYPVSDGKGGKVLSPISRQQCIDVATKTSMVLQAYFWDDIILDPIKQANWVAQVVKTEGLPIKWTWIDQEQWWTNWTAWQQARGGRISMNEVPKGSPANISSHFENFMRQLYSQDPKCGVYTNRGFVSTWAPGMDKWLHQYRAWVPNYGKQPKEATLMTWGTLKEKWLPNYEVVLSAGQRPELVVGHQFTGDKIKLPGSYSKFNGPLVLDVSVFSKSFIDEIRGTIPIPQPAPTPPPVPTPEPAPANPPGTVAYVVNYARVNVRTKPDSNSAWVRFAVKDEVLNVILIENEWAKLADGTYIYAGYISRIPVNTPAPTEPPVPAPTPLPQPAMVDYVVLHTRINVRTRPDSTSTWVRFAVKDEVLKVVKVENGWAKLADDTYVFAGYLKKI